MKLDSSDGTTVADTKNDTNKFGNIKFSKAINRIAGAEGSYKIYVENYIVKSVVYSNFESGRYKGTYPKTTEQLVDSDLSALRVANVQEADMTVMELS